MKFQSFKEFCEERDSLYAINEMPMVFSKVNDEYVDEFLKTYIRNNANSFRSIDSEVYSYPVDKMTSVYIIIKDDTVVGGCTMTSTEYCDKDYIYPKIVKKFVDDYPGLALKLYKAAYNSWKVPVISDKLQSKDASAMWKKWYADPSKYGIKEVGVIDTTNKDCDTDNLTIDDIWGTDKDKMNKLVWIRF